MGRQNIKKLKDLIRSIPSPSPLDDFEEFLYLVKRHCVMSNCATCVFMDNHQQCLFHRVPNSWDMLRIRCCLKKIFEPKTKNVHNKIKKK